MNMISLFLLIFVGFSQQCSVSAFPPILPITSGQTIYLNLNQYFQGPNITYSLSQSHEGINLQPKILLQKQSHNLGKIISIKYGKNIITLLGISSTSKYYIYYSSLDEPQNLKGIHVPDSLTECTDHAVSEDGSQVSITCQSKSTQVQNYGIGRYLMQTQKWQIVESHKFEVSKVRKIEYLHDNKLAIVIIDDENSYIQLWNMKYLFVMKIFDRVFLGLSALNITDVQVSQDSLYVLDYISGIYALRVDFDTLSIQNKIYLQYYTKFAVIHQQSVVVGRQGSIAQIYMNMDVDNVRKYQLTRLQIINKIVMSQLYIVVYGQTVMSIYLRQQIQPYVQFQHQGLLFEGVLISQAKVIQYVQTHSSQTQIQLQEIQIQEALLTVPSSQSLNNQSVTVVSSKDSDCKLSFLINIVDVYEYEIYENTYSLRFAQNLYLNKPGKLKTDLAKYGIGPNISYEAQIFNDKLNTTTKVNKINNITHNITSRVTAVNKLYSSDNGYLVFEEVSDSIMKYMKCEQEEEDHLNCSNVYQQKIFMADTIFKISHINNKVYEFSVNPYQQNAVLIRILPQTNSQFPRIVAKIYSDKTNKYGQNNITQIQVNDKHIFMVVPAQKQIVVYAINQQQSQQKPIITVQFLNRINRDTFNGDVYFAPHQLVVDRKGRLWVKQYFQVLLLEFRNNKTQLKSVIQVTNDIVLTYTFTYNVVNGEYMVLSSYRQTLYYCYLPNPIPYNYSLGYSQCKQLPKYGMILQQKHNTIDLLGQYKIGIVLTDLFKRSIYYSVYDLQSLQLVSMYYGQVQFVNQTIYGIFRFNREQYEYKEYKQHITFIQVSPSNSIIQTHKIYMKPSLDITIPDVREVQQQLSIKLFIQNRKVINSHVFTLNIVNYVDNITQGRNYPYRRQRIQSQQVIDKPKIISTIGWLKGSVIYYNYACTQCDNEIQIIDKIWNYNYIPILGGFDFVLLDQSRVGVIRDNMIYVIDYYTHNLHGLYQLTLQHTDQIQKLKVNYESRLAVALVRKQNGNSEIVVYSMTNYKGFPIHAYPLSNLFVVNMQYINNIITISTLQGIYIFIVTPIGQVINAEYISAKEAGGNICWAQLFQGQTNFNYTSIITVCDQGIFYLSFNINENYQLLYVSNRQNLNLLASLKINSLNLPNGAYFYRTHSHYRQGIVIMLMVINNFHSVEWYLQLSQDNSTIQKITLQAMYHRYSDLTALSDVHRTQRYTYITYKGLYEEQLKVIHAVYDLLDPVNSHEHQYLNFYIMESLVRDENVHGKFVSSQVLLTLENRTAMNIYDIDNAFRATFRNASQLKTQTIFMNPITQLSHSEDRKIQIQFLFSGITEKEWGFWDTFFVIVGCIGGIIALIVIYLIVKQAKKQMKLVKLQVDEISSEQSDQYRKMSDQEEESSGNINESERESQALPN